LSHKFENIFSRPAAYALFCGFSRSNAEICRAGDRPRSAGAAKKLKGLYKNVYVQIILRSGRARVSV